MLRSKLLILLLIFSWLMPVSSFATHEENHLIPNFGDRWVPWPWALALPFPWSDIQGVWKAQDGDFVSYFSFKVVCRNSECNCYNSGSICQLQVRQYDATNCRILAKGVGVESTHKVLAQMTSKTGLIYRVDLTAFSEKDSPLPPLKSEVPIPGVMVLSMGALNVTDPDDMVNMQIMKVSSNQAERFCIEDIKN